MLHIVHRDKLILPKWHLLTEICQCHALLTLMFYFKKINK